MRAHLVLYVADQERSTRFYAAVLGTPPQLDVPGMTEFALGGGAVLGLMPAAGIRRLLPGLDTGTAAVARAELYLRLDSVEEAVAAHARALEAGAVELSAPAPRGWGDRAGYVRDLDGHVVAFACSG